MRSFKTEAIILKRLNFSEADKIITIFSKKNGKQKIKALGVRKIKSRRSPHVELFNHSSLTLYQGKNLPILTESLSLENFYSLKSDLKRVGFAYHICELVNELCAENQENERVFYLLLKTLKNLDSENNFLEICYNFELELLKILGFYKPQSSLSLENLNTQVFIENILEKKLKTKQILFKLS